MTVNEELGIVTNEIMNEIFELYHDRAFAEFWRGIRHDQPLIVMAIRLFWRDVDHKTPPTVRQIMQIVNRLKLGDYPDVEPM